MGKRQLQGSQHRHAYPGPSGAACAVGGERLGYGASADPFDFDCHPFLAESLLGSNNPVFSESRYTARLPLTA